VREATRCNAHAVASCRVSIHASVREATERHRPLPRMVRVSIHASVREATQLIGDTGATHSCFNPRLRAGGDGRSSRPSPPTTSFNPRLRAGGDSLQGQAHRGPDGFNPRLRAGGDVLRGMPVAGGLCFNPRLRAGGDEAGYRQFLFPRVSIHASVREATWTALPHRPSATCFNPRLRAGGDRDLLGNPDAQLEFQSTPPCGRRRRK